MPVTRHHSKIQTPAPPFGGAREVPACLRQRPHPNIKIVAIRRHEPGGKEETGIVMLLLPAAQNCLPNVRSAKLNANIPPFPIAGSKETRVPQENPLALRVTADATCSSVGKNRKRNQSKVRYLKTPASQAAHMRLEKTFTMFPTLYPLFHRNHRLRLIAIFKTNGIRQNKNLLSWAQDPRICPNCRFEPVTLLHTLVEM
ncbi:hypothetical protein R3P38DRAFT_2777129 [Favolaschia claudopus]|uniref:Uncharacterized protein n=1 Tax=Favolaschia claudopus TaxID=2862362 RepID=A0AAW0BKK4_9AGAR